MLENIKAVIFDMDGTLIDSMWLWRNIDIVYLKKYGHELPEDLQECIDGKSFTEVAYYFKERFKLSDSVETIKAEWNSMAMVYYKDRVTLKIGANEFLDYLKKNEYKLAIGTSNSREMVGIIAERFNWEPYFHVIKTSCEVEKGKPSPDIYLSVAEDLNVKPEECLVFEDIPVGIIAAKSAGMKCCAVHDEYSERMKEEKMELADYYIDNFIQGIPQLRGDK